MNLKGKNEKGITLVALVVTIVVLIILATISINAIFGEDGIIKRAEEAKQSYLKGEQNDLDALESLESQISEIIGKGESEEDKTTLKFLVNSGEDGIVVLPVDINEVTSVDWGDGSITTAQVNEKKVETTTKLASIDGIKLAEMAFGAYEGPYHQYQEKNKEYEVTIKGNITSIDTKEYGAYIDNTGKTIYYYEIGGLKKIIEITQWGTTGLEEIRLERCSNLRKIASPDSTSFVNVTSFTDAFYNCTSLKEIPSDLFANCPNVTEFQYAFEGCTNLTGLAPELWKLGTNSESNNYQGNPDGKDCFYNCTGLTNYADIPEYWK